MSEIYYKQSQSGAEKELGFTPKIPEISATHLHSLVVNTPRFSPETYTYDENDRIREAGYSIMRKQTAEGPVEVIIDQHGGVVTSYSVNGKQILAEPTYYAKYGVEDKARGGMPVMVPNMGRDPRGEFRMHGLAEISKMHIDEELTDIAHGRMVHYVLGSEVPGNYPFSDDSVIAIIHEIDDEGGLTTTCQVQNNSDRDLSLAPGFHPYFALNKPDNLSYREFIAMVLRDFHIELEGDDELLRQQLVSTIQLPLTQTVQNSPTPHGLSFYPSSGINVLTHPLYGLDDSHSQVWIWTDQDNSICIEYAAAVDTPHIELVPGESQTYSSRIIAIPA